MGAAQAAVMMGDGVVVTAPPNAIPVGIVPGKPTHHPMGGCHSSASLILAQDERWRRA